MKAIFVTVMFLSSYVFAAGTVDNVHIENCEKYPYIGINQKQSGTVILREDINRAMNGLNQCLNDHEKSHEYLKEQYQKLFRLMSSKVKKTFTCTFGKFNSFNAFASFNPHHISSHQNDLYGIKSHPEILLDINRMAGNFPLNMTDRKKKDFIQFYKNRLTIEDIIPGKRNPYLSRVENPISLIAHEMIHWTGFYHSERAYPDLSYLAQMCCFSIRNVKETYRDQACEILYRKDFWEGKPEYLEKQDVYNKVGQLVAKLRTVIDWP